MSFLEKVYDLSPIFIQNLMVSIKGEENTKSRFGKLYVEFRQFLKDFDTWSREEKLEYQRQQMIEFIRYAYENSPFYRHLYRGIDISSIQTIYDLKRLPIVDKEMLRLNIDQVLTLPKAKALEGHTGGTTGKSLVVYFTREDQMKRMAVLDHFKARLGFEHRKMRRITFNGKHIIPPHQKKRVFWRYNHSCQQMIFSSFHLTEENMRYYVQELNRFKPQSLDGFFTTMCDLASYIERHQISLTFRPVAIFPTSETLTPSGRELLERVFGCKVYDQYGSSEGAHFVTDCSCQRLHIELATGVFEPLDSSDNEILVTSFFTRGTPLIRYRIGDSMVFDSSDDLCSCGMDTPRILSIEGRKLDFLYNAEGAKINSANMCNLFKNIPNALIRAQLTQDRIGEVKLFLEIDPRLYKPEYDNLLRQEFIHKFGLGTELIINHVNEIPREKSGKFRMIKNNVDSQATNPQE